MKNYDDQSNLRKHLKNKKKFKKVKISKNYKLKTFKMKGVAIAATAFMSLSMMGPISANAVPLNHKKKDENELAANNQNEQSPVTVVFQKCKANAESIGGNIAQDISNGAGNYNLDYSIPYQFISNTGKNYDITNIKITPHFKVKYRNSESLPNQELVKQSENAITTQMAQNDRNPNTYYDTVNGINGVTSSSTGVFSYNYEHANLDYNTEVSNYFTISYEVDGKTFSQEIDAPTLNTTLPQCKQPMSLTAYFYNNAPQIPISLSFKTLKEMGEYNGNNFYYSLENYKLPEKIKFQASLSNGGILKINPKYSNDVKEISNGTYEVSSDFYVNSLCSYTPPNIFIAENSTPTQTATCTLTLGITPQDLGITNQYFDTILTPVLYDYTINFTPEVGQYHLTNNISFTNFSDNGNTCYKITGTSGENGFADYNKEITNYTVLTTNGQSNGFNLGANFSNVNDNYVYHVQGMGSPSATSQLLNDVYYQNDNGALGVIAQQLYNQSFQSINQYSWFTGSQLKEMLNNGEINTSIIVNGIMAKGNSVDGIFNGNEVSTMFNTFTVGIFNNGTEPSVLTNLWSKLSNSSYDKIYSTNNDGPCNGFILGSPINQGEAGSSSEYINPNFTNTNDQNNVLNAVSGTAQSIIRGPEVSQNCLIITNTAQNRSTYGMPNNVSSTMSAKDYYTTPIMYQGNTPSFNTGGGIITAATTPYLIINLDGQTVTDASEVQLSYTNASGTQVNKTVKLNSLPKNSNNEFYVNLNTLDGGYDIGPGVGLNFTLNYNTPKLPATSNIYFAVTGNKDAVVNSSSVTPVPNIAENIDGAIEDMGAVSQTSSDNYPYQVLPNTTQGTQGITITNYAKNKCSQTVNTINKSENTFRIDDSLTNNAYTPTSYYGIGRIPTNTKATLPSTYKDNGIGKNTDTVLTGINTSDGTSVYLIPKSLESKYTDLLNTQTVSDLSQLTTLVNSKESGLVKYTEGMDLSNYIGYIFVSPNVKENQTFNFSFDVKAEHQTPNIQNTLYSGFKYFDASHDYGSISNINEIDLTKVYNLNQFKDILNLSTNDGSSIPSGAKFKITYTNGKTSIISADKATQEIGDTGVNSVTLIPDSIQGYSVVTHNESQVVKNLSTNIDGSIDTLTTNTTNYVFHKIKNTITYKAIDQDGKIVTGVSATINDNSSVLNKDLTNKTGIDNIGSNNVTNVVTNSSSIPLGYKIDGDVTITKTIDKNGNINWVAVQKLIKEAPTSITTEVINTNGDIIIPQKAFAGYVNENINYTAPKIPAGYKLVKVTDNNNLYNPNIKENNGVIQGQSYVQHIVWTIEKEKSPVSIIYKCGNKVIVPLANSEVNTGSNLGLTIKIPTGYNETGITYNGKSTTNTDISKIDAIPTGNNVVVELSKIVNTITYKAIDQDGKVVTGVSATVNDNTTTVNKDLTNKAGVDEIGDNVVTKVTTNTSSIPVGYEINGDVVLTKSIDKDGDTHWDAIQKLTKLPPAIVTTEVQTQDGQVLVNPVSTTGIQNTEISYNTPKIPEGYHLINITDNGNNYIANKNDTVIGQASPTHLIWIVAKNTHIYQLMFTSNIEGVSYNVGTNEWSGTYSPANNELTTSPIPLNGATEKWESATAPTGYKQIGEPKITTETTGTYNKVTTTTYTYNFAPIPKVTVTNIVKLPDGKILTNLGDSDSGYPNGNVRLATPVIPAGYHLVKAPTNTPVLFPNKDVNCIWLIAKNETIVHCKYVDAQTGELVNGGTFKIDGKVENNAVLPQVPTVDVNINKIPVGYREVGKINFTNSYNVDENQVINAVQKLEKIENKVEYKAIDQDGKIVTGVSATVNDNSSVLNKDLTNKDGLENIADSNVSSAVTNTASIPVGYEETGKLSITPIKDSNGNITYEIIQHLIKLAPANVTTEVINSTGKVLVPQTSYTGYEGDTIAYKVPKIPKGYKIIEITDNNKSYTPNTNILHPNTGSVEGTTDTQNIVWKVEKENTNVTVKYMDNGKEIGSPSTSNIKTGTPLSSIKLNCPNGYKIVNIDVNGSIMKNGVVTGNALPTPNTIIVNLDKLHETINVTSTCNGIDIAGTTIKTNTGSLTTAASVISNQVAYNSYKNAIVDKIPTGYKQVGKINVTKTTDSEGNQIVNINVPLQKLEKGIVTTIVLDSSNKLVVPLQSYNGYVGTTDTASVPKIPVGYKIVKVTNNGEEVNGLPKNFNDGTQNIVWHVIKEDSNVTVKVIYKPTGKELGNPMTSEIKTGTPLNSVKLPNFDGHYNIVSINVNGKNMTDNTVTGDALPTPNEIIITVNKPAPKDFTDKVTVKTVNGDILVPTKTTVGTDGTSTGLSSDTIVPAGWEIVNVTDNGQKSSMADKSIENVQNENTNTVITVKKIEDTVTTKIIDENGNIIVPSKTTNVSYDSDITGLIPSVPTGYTLVKVIYNNNDYNNINEIPSKIIKNTNVTLIVKKIEKGTITTKVVSKDGQDLVPEKSYTGIVGTNDTAVVPIIPNGWKLVGITNNGKTVEGLPASYTNSTQNIVWIVEKIQKQVPAKVVVKIVDKATGQEIGTPVTTSATVGTDINSNYMPTIPTGYTNEGVTTDGVTTGMAPQGKVAPGINNIIVYVNKKVVVNKPVKETVNAKVIEAGTGKILNSNPTITVNKGTPLNGSFLPTVQKGYKIDSITVNGVKEDNGISGVVNAPTNIVVTVSPIAKGSITVIVKDTTGNIVVKESEATGLDNTADTLKEPVIPNGYKIIKITNNGVNCSGMPKDFTGSTQNIVYTVQKESTTVTTSVVTDNGVTLQAPSTVNAKIGVALDGYIPLAPKGYKVSKVEVNGTYYTNALGVNGNTLSTPNNIIVYVTKDAPIVPKTPNKPVIQNKGKITVTVETNEGKTLIPTVEYEGLSGADDTASIPTIPAGYTLDKITNNGEVVNGLPKEFNDGTQNIIYVVSKVQKDINITTTVETENGKILVNPATVTGKTGNATGLDLTIPKGYHLVKITSNNQDIQELPSKFGKENQNIIIIVEKDASVPTKAITPAKNETPSKKLVSSTKKETVESNNITTSNVKVNTPVTTSNVNVNTPVATSNSPTSTNPKTGDSSNIPFAVGIFGAIAGLFVVNKKKKKDTTLNKNS